MNQTYRIAHEAALWRRRKATACEPRLSIWRTALSLSLSWSATALRITAFLVNHRTVEGAVGYRFDYKGRSIVVSGDTAPSPNLVNAATGADLLVHEAMSPAAVRLLAEAARANGRNAPAALFGGVTDFHTTPEQSAAEAQAAGVRVLALTHFIPPVPMNPLLQDLFLGEAAKKFRGALLLAEDGDLVTLPAASKDWSEHDLLD